MARGIIRKPSFNKILGAYRSQWKRFWRKLFSFGLYGRKGVGWFTDPKKAWYNFWYNRTSVSVYRLLGCKSCRGTWLSALFVAILLSVVAAPADATREAVRAHKIRKNKKERVARVAAERAKRDAVRPTKEQFVAPKKTPVTTAPKSETRAKPVPKPAPAPEPAPVHTAPIRYGAPLTDFQTTVKTVPTVEIERPVVKIEDDQPISTPHSPKDRYIRKRMVIAGTAYQSPEAVSRLAVGCELQLVAEPDNPHDKNAVALYYDGVRIGYIPRADAFTYKIALQLGRTIYGVVVEIRSGDTGTAYLFETWFAGA